MDFQLMMDFLARLQIYNDRNWFNENKDLYKEAHTEFVTFVNALIPPLCQLDPSIGTPTAEECMFRIYRDVRFSNNKLPYKTHFSAFIANGGRKTRFAGYYIHIEPGDCFASGGIYMPEAKELTAIRNAIYQQPDEFRRIIDKPSFKKYFPDGITTHEDTLKNPPKGYPKDFKEIDILKNKHFTTGHLLDDGFFLQNDVVGELMKIFKEQYSLNAFLNGAISY
jgi:uncharacterized protein (TIGR02453 family)